MRESDNTHAHAHIFVCMGPRHETRRCYTLMPSKVGLKKGRRRNIGAPLPLVSSFPDMNRRGGRLHAHRVPPRPRAGLSTSDRVVLSVLVAGLSATGITGAVMYAHKRSKISEDRTAISVGSIVCLATNYEGGSGFNGGIVYAEVGAAQENGLLPLVFNPQKHQDATTATRFRVVRVSDPPTSAYLHSTVGVRVAYVLELYEDTASGQVGAKGFPSGNWEVFMGNAASHASAFYISRDGAQPAIPPVDVGAPVEFGFYPTGGANLYASGIGGAQEGQVSPAGPVSGDIHAMYFLTPQQLQNGPHEFPFFLQEVVPTSSLLASSFPSVPQYNDAAAAVSATTKPASPSNRGNPPAYIDNGTSEGMMIGGFAGAVGIAVLWIVLEHKARTSTFGDFTRFLE